MTRQEAEQILDHARLHVLLDPREPGVEVPEDLRADEAVILVFSKYFNQSLEVDDDKICQVLSFGGHDFPVTVPFSAILDHRALAHDFQPAPAPGRPRLRLVGDD